MNMNPTGYDIDVQQAADFAKQLVSLTPTDTSVTVAIGGALTYATALAFDNVELAHRTATAMRLMAADLARRAAVLAAR